LSEVRNKVGHILSNGKVRT